jgi:lysozyme
VKTSQSGISLIKSFEGLKFYTYIDAVGVPTIGYGHTGPEVKAGQRITLQKAELLLQNDLIVFEKAVEKYVQIELNQNQFDALVSFTYNVGAGALAESTLLKRLNAKESRAAVSDILRREFEPFQKKLLSGYYSDSSSYEQDLRS